MIIPFSRSRVRAVKRGDSLRRGINRAVTRKKNDMNTENSNSERQAACQLESIREMVKPLSLPRKDSDETAREEAIQTIRNDALTVEVRSGWHPPGDKTNSDGWQYNILLCTGGPAVRIIGDLSDQNEPETARLEHQDWGTPWTEYRMDSEEKKDVLIYAAQFYFGE